MPRQARIDIPGLLQHVIVRGVGGTDIFLVEEDREDLYRRLTHLLQETKTRCFSWVFLDNHIHLLLLPTEQSLAHVMRRLLTGYAVAFNLRHKRSGHLFQNRYKSIVCDADNYLLELVRYIHLNPIRAGMVVSLEDLSSYQWCGHRQLVGCCVEGLIACDEIMAMFSTQRQIAVRHYLSFLADGLKDGKGSRLSVGGRRASQCLDESLPDDGLYDDRILGGGAFAEGILSKAELFPVGRGSLERLITKVADYYCLQAAELVWPCRQAEFVRAKAVICYWANRRWRISGVELAKNLGYSTSAVSLAAKRGQNILAGDEELSSLLTEMDK